MALLCLVPFGAADVECWCIEANATYVRTCTVVVWLRAVVVGVESILHYLPGVQCSLRLQ